MREDYGFDPAYRPRDAAKYCGRSLRTLERHGVERECVYESPHGTRHNRYVYRRSKLNAYLNAGGRPMPRKRRRRQ